MGDHEAPTSNGNLLEVGNRDLWQLALISGDGHTCGRVIRQLVEPSMYTIRYVIIYDGVAQRHIPIPADAIQEITNEAVICKNDAASLLSLPTLSDPFDRSQEEQVHETLSMMPYWIEEAGLCPGSCRNDEH